MGKCVRGMGADAGKHGSSTPCDRCGVWGWSQDLLMSS